MYNPMHDNVWLVHHFSWPKIICSTPSIKIATPPKKFVLIQSLCNLACRRDRCADATKREAPVGCGYVIDFYLLFSNGFFLLCIPASVMYKGPENSRNIVEEHRKHPVCLGLANEIERGSFLVLLRSKETLYHLLQTHISDDDSVFAVDKALHYLNFFCLSDIFQTAIVLAEVSTANSKVGIACLD